MKHTSFTRRAISLLMAAVLCFCPIPRAAFAAEEDVNTYQLVDAPGAGDTVVLYNPGNGRILSADPSGSYLTAAVPDSVGENRLTSGSDSVGWTVSVDENGSYRFSQRPGSSSIL